MLIKKIEAKYEAELEAEALQYFYDEMEQYYDDDALGEVFDGYDD